MDKSYDLVVIGAGPGGYVAAIRAAQLGLSVACIEKNNTLGGTCLNIGCIPSKALLHSSEEYTNALKGLSKHGINVNEVSLDLKIMMENKDSIVGQLTKGISMLFEKNDIDHFTGKAKLLAPDLIEVKKSASDVVNISAKSIIIATGSEPATLPNIDIDETRIVSSTGALKLKHVPDHLIVIGGGYIGLELGSVWRRLGAKVTVVEFLDRITPGIDEEVATQFQRLLKRQKIKFKLNTKVTSAVLTDSGVSLNLEKKDGGEVSNLDGDIVLVAVGRNPHTNDLGLKTIGVETDERGFIKVNADFKTNIEGVYAIGDVIAGPMLAHKAEEEGAAVAEIICGEKPHVNYNTIPSVIYTHPEVASVGKNEQQLQAEGKDYKIGNFPFMANGRAKAMSSTDGFVKILACTKTDKILGVHIIGKEAGTLIAEAVLAMEFGGSSEDIARTCHAHPTLNETLKEAALALDNRAVHF